MTDGKLSGVQHFDSKAAVETYIRNLPIKSAFYMPAFYTQNFLVMFKPKPVSNAISKTLDFSICVHNIIADTRS